MDLIKKNEKAILRKIYSEGDFDQKFDTLQRIRDADPNTAVSMASLQDTIDFVK